MQGSAKRCGKSPHSDIQKYADEEGRPLPDDFEVCLYYNIRVTQDREKGIEETAAYLKDYYGVQYDREFLERWVAIGSPQCCIEEIAKFVEAGATTITLRLIGHDEKEQFQRVTEDVLPALVS